MLLSRAVRHQSACFAATLTVCTLVVMQANSLSLRARLQDVADTAALAGLNSLVSSSGRPDVERRAASIAAAKGVVAARAHTVSEIWPSPDGAELSVIVRDTELGKQTSATAHYVAPSGDAPSHQSSNVSFHAAPNGTM